MAEKFVTPCELPTPYERELLTILIEECAEVQQRATKLLRFGRDEVQPGQSKSNRERLSAEIGDLMAMIDRCVYSKLVLVDMIDDAANDKLEKLKTYMQTMPAHVGG